MSHPHETSEWSGEVREEHRPTTCEARSELIVCTTCDEPAGARLLEQLRRALRTAQPEAPIALGSIACLWACQRSCVAQIRSTDRMGYVLGDFPPSEDSARLLLAFIERYLASRDGVVLHPDWPAGLRGHFVCRVPPAPRPVI